MILVDLTPSNSLKISNETPSPSTALEPVANPAFALVAEWKNPCSGNPKLCDFFGSSKSYSVKLFNNNIWLNIFRYAQTLGQAVYSICSGKHINATEHLRNVLDTLWVLKTNTESKYAKLD